MKHWRPPGPSDILRPAAEQRHFVTGAKVPPLGVGLPYRRARHDQIMAHRAEIGWLEIPADTFLPLTAQRLADLDVLREHFGCVPHGPALALAEPGPPDEQYLNDLCAVADAVAAPWLAGRLCRTRGGRARGGRARGGPAQAPQAALPRTREVAVILARKAREIQARAIRPFLLENPACESPSGGELTEAQFLCEVLYRSDCWLRLDVNHLHANRVNFQLDPYEFLDQIPLERVLQIHMTGGQDDGQDHGAPGRDAPVPEPVWELADYVITRTSVRGVLLDRGSARPADVGDLLGDVRRARGILGPADDTWPRLAAGSA